MGRANWHDTVNSTVEPPTASKPTLLISTMPAVEIKRRLFRIEILVKGGAASVANALQEKEEPTVTTFPRLFATAYLARDEEYKE